LLNTAAAETGGSWAYRAHFDNIPGLSSIFTYFGVPGDLNNARFFA
jgi:hypothetical protein